MHGDLPPMSLLIILGFAWAGQPYQIKVSFVTFFLILLNVIAVLNMRLS
jgi:hypothetical protein